MPTLATLVTWLPENPLEVDNIDLQDPVSNVLLFQANSLVL